MAHSFCISEADAKRKRCCASIEPVCIASECMAWRWVETNINERPGDPLVASHNTHGYCGLAGKPR